MSDIVSVSLRCGLANGVNSVFALKFLIVAYSPDQIEYLIDLNNTSKYTASRLVHEPLETRVAE